MFSRKQPRHTVAALLVAALLTAAAAGLTAPAIAETFPDTTGLPAELQQAVDYVTARGWMNGGDDGNFHPNDPILRLEYCCALTRLFGVDGEQTDPGIHFTDLPDSDPGYRYANLSVKHGYIQPYPDGSFQPYGQHSAAAALSGLVAGLELDGAAEDAQGLYPFAPAYSGVSIAANDLHLKYRDTRVLPTGFYPRVELAYSLQRADQMEEWRLDYVEETFNWLRCQTPLMGVQRDRAIASAFSKMGYPYVWGGESDAEGGYDCSGLVYYVLGSCLGHPMMRCADDQAADGRYAALSRPELLAGDPIFFYDSSGDGSVGHAGIYVGRGLFIHSTGSNAGVSVDYLDDGGYWGSHFACGKRVIGEGEPASFDTYVLLMNPDGTPATARLTYQLKDGRQIAQEVGLEPYTRETVRVDDTLVNQEFSCVVDATQGRVIAERSMYFRYLDTYPGGHSSPGVTGPSTDWYLAEGCTAYGFDTYVLLQNPSDQASEATLTFMNESGNTVAVQCTVGPFSRDTVCVDSVSGMEQSEFSTRVTSSRPLVVERSMYFDYLGIKEGHSSAGLTELSNEWYFAEGYTGGGFDTYVLLANPTDYLTHVTMTLFGDGGAPADIEFGIAPHARRTIAVDDIRGWSDRAFSIRLRATQPVAAERAMYFDYEGIEGGHGASGAPAPRNQWYLAEGYTAGAFDTYVLLSNPGDEEADVSVRFMLNGGSFVDETYNVPPRSRFTIPVDAVDGLSAEEVGTLVSSDRPVVVERSTYFSYLGRSGGTCSSGVGDAADRWYFAEGYTGR
ncbi:MAG: C40 family peptidase [Actinobacteria bacterium]|nr:C40 family peptidase [Actinomycetota bacterium]MBU2686276.1 C40 family peptidase [Actinomycetota bacterium]